ncbi:MAG TPA: phosphate ABC transporter permease PstA [Pirellulales bacterium]|jgi:phosphate transport system permease protein|nr:phosphate ABC transporter permease PstA [Pirellulales bacterium]
MKPRSIALRRASDRLVKVIATASAMIGLVALAWILCVILANGASAINWTFLTHLPVPPGVTGGGLFNAICGTVLMTGVATLVGVPIGLLAGVFLAEFGKTSAVAPAVRFAANVLMGTPSILIGVFVYALVVVPMGHFSGLAGAVALAIIILPVVTRTTEDMLYMVPDSLREAALALGSPRWKVTLGIVFRAAKSGLLTGILLAVARVSGESAPLLFTALNSPYSVRSLGQPTANLTVTIYNYALSPYADWRQMAWGASLLITAGVLSLMIIARLTVRGRESW